VTWANAAPLAAAGLGKTVAAGPPVTLDGSASMDPDDGIASFLWHQTGGAPVTLSDPTVANPTFTAPSSGADANPITFMLTVTDKGGLKSTATQTITVKYNGPDVRGKWVSFSNYCNKSLSGALQVSNLGNLATGSFTNAFYLSNDGNALSKLLKTQTVSSLKSGQSVNLSLQYTGTSLKGKYIIAVIDSGNAVQDVNKTDNSVKVLIP
jgi:hypothetical protein